VNGIAIPESAGSVEAAIGPVILLDGPGDFVELAGPGFHPGTALWTRHK
jgi:hypothetical protein